jgi:hypothetical protein
MEERTAGPIDESGEKVSNDEHELKPHRPWSRNVDPFLTSIPILLCCFCSGLIDSTVFNAWGVFATMQTGAIYLTTLCSAAHI